MATSNRVVIGGFQDLELVKGVAIGGVQDLELNKEVLTQDHEVVASIELPSLHHISLHEIEAIQSPPKTNASSHQTIYGSQIQRLESQADWLRIVHG